MHTRGPWNVQGGEGKHGDLYVWKAGEYFGGHALATVHEEVEEGAKDNAALICAAPELLAALKRVVPWLGKMIADNGHIRCARPDDAVGSLRMAEAAISKAEGRE